MLNISDNKTQWQNTTRSQRIGAEPVRSTANGNYSNSYAKILSWTICAEEFVLIPAVLLNMWILAAYVRRKRLITPFSIYIRLNAAIDLAMAVALGVYGPPQTLRPDYFKLHAWDGFLKYCQWTLPSISMTIHAIICLDRWLALLRPVWYRRKPRKFGWLAFLFCFVLQQALIMAYFINDMLATKGNLAARARIENLVMVFVFISYPILLAKIYLRRRPRLQNHPVQSSASGHRHQPAHSDPPLPTAVAPAHRGADMRMTVSLLLLQMVFWLPYSIVGAYNRFINITGSEAVIFSLTLFFRLGHMLCLVDPLVYLACLPDLRKLFAEDWEAVRRFCGCRRSRNHSSAVHVLPGQASDQFPSNKIVSAVI